MDWMLMAACALAIGVAGARLTRLAEAIGGATGWSRSWLGVLLLATVTSLPELATGISAVRIAEAPDLAVGDALGSTIFNLMLLVVLDVLHRRSPMYEHASSAHVLSAAFGVMLLGVVGSSVLLHQQHALPAIGHVGPYTVLLAIIYLIAMRSVFGYERRGSVHDDGGGAEGSPRPSLRGPTLRFGAFTLVVVAAGSALPALGSRIAADMGWTHTFVGTLLVAASTSLPEVVVTLAAWRIGALDLAIGGLLGSNLFDLLIIAIDDLLYLPGPILASVSPDHAITAFCAAMMTSAVIAGLVYRPRQRLLRMMSLVSFALAAVYLVNLIVLLQPGS